ncbi:MAG: tetratricopeptide repeat protein [Bacteroidia bacterium]|nr:tetratricopeptide repeat protein [Bacteroidia bacterium]
MSSIIEGYSYDIFISYRQKDNKYDGWVTEFVYNLKNELEATFKEEISVYFDINPHDGLLKTHDVDASLKDKLKCLVFIPIISRTYCDPKSFAWEHEFKAFIDLASQDQFGLKVKLPNGNVASRVLPIRIYDLNNTDIKLCETILGGVLRGVDFFYAETGVNRPLKPDDDEKTNLNKTKYRNQINKVGNAIQEIISGLLTEPIELVKEKPHLKEPSEEVKKEERREVQEKSTKTIKRKLLSGVVILAILIIAAILTYPKIFKKDTIETLRSSGERISVAVMPFRNMTNDTVKNDWQNWIQDILITSLSNSEELKVRQSESINTYIQSKGLTNYASITPSVASTISRKLNANVVIYGSVIKEGTKIRVNAQLINSKTENIYKSFQKDGADENIITLIDTLSAQIRDFLIRSIMEKEIIMDFRQMISTNSSVAYKYYMFGNQAFYKYDFPTASEWYRKAIGCDSSFTEAIRMLTNSLGNQGLIKEMKKWSLRNYQNRDQMSEMERLWAEIGHADTPDEKIKYFKLLIALDDELPVPHSNLGYFYNILNLYDKAITEFEKELEIYEKWSSIPRWSMVYTDLGYAYHQTDQYKKEKKLYKKAEKDFPGDQGIIRRQAILSLTFGKVNAANEYIEKYKSILKNNGESEAGITMNLAGIYSEAGIRDRSEQYRRQALSSEPGNSAIMNNLAYFLIDNDRDIDEGLELVETALKISPDNYNYLHTKGWVLYKKGKFQESLDILQRSWDLRRQNAGYDHEAFLHLEAAKKAVAGLK